MNWNRWVRQVHRWLSIIFTVGVLINIVAVVTNRYTAWVGLIAVVPIFLLLLTGLYLFALPYINNFTTRGVDSARRLG
jgi:hypothetical protein